MPPAALSLCAPRPESGPALEALLQPVIARAAESITLGPLHGYIDAIHAAGIIERWAMDKTHPDLPVLLDILLDGAVLGTVLACGYRADVAQTGRGRGRNGFRFSAPATLPPAALHAIRVRRTSDGAMLAMTPDCAAMTHRLCA
jgi:hypothetical protein